jgi:hypothetical protein
MPGYLALCRRGARRRPCHTIWAGGTCRGRVGPPVVDLKPGKRAFKFGAQWSGGMTRQGGWLLASRGGQRSHLLQYSLVHGSVGASSECHALVDSAAAGRDLQLWRICNELGSRLHNAYERWLTVDGSMSRCPPSPSRHHWMRRPASFWLYDRHSAAQGSCGSGRNFPTGRGELRVLAAVTIRRMQLRRPGEGLEELKVCSNRRDMGDVGRTKYKTGPAVGADHPRLLLR